MNVVVDGSGDETRRAAGPLGERQLVVVERWTLGLALVAIAAAHVALSTRMSLGVTLGAALMALNAIVLRRVGARLVRKATRSPAAVLLLNAKMALLVGLVYVVVRYLPVDPIGFLIGVSVFPVAVVAAAVQLGVGASSATEGK